MSTSTTSPAPEASSETGTSLWKDAWLRLRKNTLSVIGPFIFLAITLSCITSLPIQLTISGGKTDIGQAPDKVLFTIPGWYPHNPSDQMLSLGATKPFEKLVQVDAVDSQGRVTTRYITLQKLSGTAVERVRDGRRPRAITDAERASILEAVQASKSFTLGDSTYQISSRTHILGTDTLGRDLFSRIMQGGRVSLGVGFAATLVSILIGVLYGSISAYVGGKTDSVMMRIVDILYSVPFTILVIVLMTVLDTRSLLLLFVAIGCVEWLTMARIVRGQVLTIKKMEFIEAAHALGLSNRRIVLRHIIPNVLGPVIVFATLTVPAVMLLEAALSFLGLGVQPPTASWGVLIKEGSESMQVYPWLLLFPAFVFSLTLFCLNFLGDGLRDALDVKASKE